jgi:protein TonB
MAAADRQPVLIKQTDPNAGISNAGVIFDVAQVELTVDQFGVPFSLKSSIGLPENAVDAIASWRYSPFKKGGADVPFVSKMKIRIARKITPVMDRSFGGFLYPSAEEIKNAVRTAKKLDQAAADALEAKLNAMDDSVPSRSALLVYYSGVAAKLPENARTKRATLLSWLIQNAPKTEILGSPFALVNNSGEPLADQEAASKLTDLWLKAVSLHSGDPIVVQHALNFLRVTNPQKANDLLNTDYARQSGTGNWKGAIDAYSALGVTAINPITGSAVAAPAATSEFAAGARQNLLSSTDALTVLTGLTILTHSGRSLAALKQLPAAFDDFCPKLLAHAKTLYPDTTQSCDTTVEAPNDLIPVGDVDGKIADARLTKKVAPQYPDEAKRRRVTGTILLSAIVSKTGDIDQLGFTSGPLMLYHSALDAVQNWKYSPTQIDGKPVDISTVVTVNYTLQR